MRQLGWRLPYVYLSTESLRHIFIEHPDITQFDVLHMPLALKVGLLVHQRQRPLCVVASYQPKDDRRRFLMPMKLAHNRCEIWVTSYHSAAKNQTGALLRSGQKLRDHV